MAQRAGCINSFGVHGFGFTLYTCGGTADVPRFGRRDATEALVPTGQLFIAHGGVETSTELFIYRFLEQVGGWYVNVDVVCDTSCLPDVEIAFVRRNRASSTTPY